MKIAIVTTCTNRKKASPHPLLCANDLPKGDQQSLLFNWAGRVEKASERIPAIHLYSGRGFSEIRKVTHNKSIDLWVVSAGLGLINGDKNVPPYNLTISPSAQDSVQNRLSVGSFDPKSWWKGLNKQLHNRETPLSDLIKDCKDTIFIISLPQTYLSFISLDLFNLEAKDLLKVRFLGLNSRIPMPFEFRHYYIPYDERFDGPDSPNPGTRADFSQRVTRHFIENILSKNPHSTPTEHANSVLNTLSKMRQPSKFNRTQKTDDQIKVLIIKNWETAKGSGARSLRILRDQESVACEQGRFANLFREIKTRIT